MANLAHILKHGLVNKDHEKADGNFVSIGNLEIIDVRSSTKVNIEGYGFIGEYVPFYLTPRSIMLFNIITGHYAPKVPRRSKDELVVIRCLIGTLAQQPKWFFTDGQANDGETTHFDDLKYLNKIDWDSIQNSNFSKSDGDYDRQRRYQAEFLVHKTVPASYIESISVYNEKMKSWAERQVNKAGIDIPIFIHKPYFFD
jgi:hypothetical protein